MKQFRRIIFWCHLVAGLFAGIVVFVMSVTGVLLTYEKQMTVWADTRNYRIVPPSPAGRVPIETLIARAREANPTTTAAAPTLMTFRSDADAPAVVAFGRESQIFINPYTGEVLGEGSKRTRDFFRVVTDIHRWLGARGESRTVGRAITGASNLAFLFLVTSGLYLWMPRRWTRKQIRNVAWFRRGLSGRARNFNWHNVIGFWCLIPLFVVVLSGVVISYAWAGNLVYRIVGETPPVPRVAPSPPPQGQNQGQPLGNSNSSPRDEVERRNAHPDLSGLDMLVARVEQHTASWQSIAMQLPTAPDAPVTFTIDEGNGGQPQKRAQLTLDRTTGEVVRWEPFANSTRGRRLRSILRFAHTGEVAGVIGQSVAGVASLGGAFLVWTGLSLAWRRFRAWRVGRSKSSIDAGGVL